MASGFVKSILKEKDEIIIETIKDRKEKYGRYLALVYIIIEPSLLTDLSSIRSLGNYYCLSDILVRKGLAEEYMI